MHSFDTLERLAHQRVAERQRDAEHGERLRIARLATGAATGDTAALATRFTRRVRGIATRLAVVVAGSKSDDRCCAATD